MNFFAALRVRNASTFRRTNLLPQSYHVRICRAAIDTNKTRIGQVENADKLQLRFGFLAHHSLVPLGVVHGF